MCFPSRSQPLRSANRRSRQRRERDRYVPLPVSAESVAISSSEEPMPARLETGVSYVAESTCVHILRNAGAEIHGAEGESVFAEGEEESVGEIDGETEEMTVVVKRRLGMADVVVADERGVVDEKHVGGDEAAQHANDGLEETDVDVVVEGSDGAGDNTLQRPTADVARRR